MRPSAFSAALGHAEAYANKTLKQLVAEYRSDVKSCRLVNERTPPKDRQSGAVRVLQWNVKNCELQGDQEFAEPIFDLDADIVVLQECGDARDDIYNARKNVGKLAGKLFAAGFKIFPAGVKMPILLATRLPVEFFEAVPLDRDLHGSGLFVAAFAQLSLRGGRRLGVYGIHLNHHCRDGLGARLDQIRALLRHAKERINPDTPLMAVGDFNQQRRRDYHQLEWQHIVASMNKRGEPLDDGVCWQLEDAGFTCCFDFPDAARNWSSDQPPPLTHWTLRDQIRIAHTETCK
mmetsp:Transcript_172955/g.554580  ORF Transcript_172955/g.554580 Transcript_172955/m.554580 type:complete len:290 (-) Transcript_172955:2-871(-)